MKLVLTVRYKTKVMYGKVHPAADDQGEVEINENDFSLVA